MTLTNSAACASHERVLGPRELSSDAYSSILAVLGIRHRATGAIEVVARGVAQGPPPTRAGGQHDGSYTNSLKLKKEGTCPKIYQKQNRGQPLRDDHSCILTTSYR